MKPIFAALAVVALSLFAAPAFADWEGTHWGASVEETITAAGGDTAKVKPTIGTRVFGEERRARGTGTFDGVAIDREFFFDSHKRLSLVKLSPKGTDCGDFVTAVRKKLGPAQSAETETFLKTPMHRAIWRDRDAGHVILMADIRFANGIRFCHLIYQPYGDGEPGFRGPDGKTRPRTVAPNADPGT